MPGTTRYSATFDRTYEEDDRAPPEPAALNGRRSRSLSLQASGALYPQQRSSSTDNGPGKVPEHIPTRTVAKTTVKSHTNPFQFVKVGTCPLYRKAEEQLKKAKEVKKPDVLKEEEEEWQSNLDSWKSRRRKMSEDVFRRQEEIKQFEMEEQEQQCNQRKTKTFSEMLESRAHRGRALSLCLMNSPLDPQIWEVEHRGSKSCANSSYSGGSEENSAVNSEDEGVSFKGPSEKNGHRGKSRSKGVSVAHSPSSSCDGLSEIETNGSGGSRGGHSVDSGLESMGGSHGAADTPDSCSDSGHDGRSSLDCDSPTTNGSYENGHAKVADGENGHAKVANGNAAAQSDSGTDLKIKLHLSSTEDALGFTFQGKQDGQVVVTSMLEGSLAQASGLRVGDRIESINGAATRFRKLSEINSFLRRGKLRGCVELSVWRRSKPSNENSHMHRNGTTNGYSTASQRIPNGRAEGLENGHSPLREPESPMNSPRLVREATENGERSVESENETYVDDFEESRVSVFSTQALNDRTPVNTQTSSQKQSPTSVEESISAGKESLNIVFESHPANSEGHGDSVEGSPLPAKQEVVPVEKVAEEMEKLILEQLEEEERAKELAAELQQAKNVEHLLTAPPRLAEPPKEKPPPPPICSNEIQKPNSLKRVNSTKRIKKEIHKRRSNFLGIENTDENIVCDASSVPPPLALEEILKAEMELDRESRRRLESATAERLTLEESEMMRREREIIESLESEERRRMLYSIYSEAPNMHHEDVSCEDDRIHDLQEERKRLEEDHLFTKEKQLILERAEYIKKQEDPDLSAPLLSATTHFPSPLSSDTLESAPPGGGDGNPALSDIVPICAPDRETAREAPPVKPKPIPPPKPLKKKEVIRKERERLRQEQEELQREKEEHRRKQEELLRSQKSHAGPDCLIANGPMRPVSSRIKSPQNDTWGQQKVPSARKQTIPDPSLSEIRYNQNHWLIQEAEMRRIAEQKERSRRIIQQQQQQVEDPRAHHPTEDGDVPRVAVPPPPALYPVQKYPPVLGSDKPLVYSRRNVVPQTPPAKPSRQQEHVLSVSGRKRCSHCGEELGRGAAMIIESLQLYYHIHCFRCCVCQARLGNGSCGADVRVRSNKLHCHNCYSNDEAGLKFSQV